MKDLLSVVAIFMSLLALIISWQGKDAALRIGAQQIVVDSMSDILISMDEYGIALGYDIKDLDRNEYNIKVLRHEFFPVRRNLEKMKLVAGDKLIKKIKNAMTNLNAVHGSYVSGGSPEEVSGLFQEFRAEIHALRDDIGSRSNDRALW